MADEVGFPRHKPGDGRAGKRGPPRSQRRADDPSHGAVTWEVDVARYITDVTAQLEALAITTHLYRLAYLLGMAKVESDRIVRTNGAPLSGIRSFPRRPLDARYPPLFGLEPRRWETRPIARASSASRISRVSSVRSQR
jgi:hypothetical protein